MALRFKIFYCLLFGTLLLSAQVEPLYFLRCNNARLQYNPGLPAHQKVHVGLGADNLFFTLNTGPFTYNNLISQGDDGYKYISVEQLVSCLKQPKDQTGGVGLRMELLDVGFSMGKTHLAVSMLLRTETALRLPGEALAYLLEGNADYVGMPVTSEISANGCAFMDIGVLLQRSFKKRFTIGVRPKFLVGLACAETGEGELRLYTDNDWNLHVGGSADFSLLYPDFKSFVSEEGRKVDFASLEHAARHGHGIGLDAGADVQITDHIGVSFSLLDLGEIHWDGQDRYHRRRLTVGVNPDCPYYEDGDLVFKGIDYEQLRQILEGENPFEHIADSLKEWLSYSWAEDSATQVHYRLTPKAYTELRYSITPKHSLSALLRTDFLPEKVAPSVTLGYSGHFPFTDIGLTYTLWDNYGRKNLLGIGFDFKSGPVHWLLTLHQLELDWSEKRFQWKNMRQVAFQAGFYFAFGKREPYKKKDKD